MPRKTTQLSPTEIKAAKPKEKEYNLSDGQGLMLRVKPSGSKLWIFNYYHPHTRKRKSISFGSYPALSLANARKQRADTLELIAQQIDPKQARDEQAAQEKEKHSQSLERVAERWHQNKKTKVTADYANDIWQSLELHIFPKLGKTPIHQITAPITIEVIEPIAAKGSLETVKRLCQRLNEIMVFAVNVGLIHHNTLSGIKESFESPNKQHMPTLKPEEIGTFTEALRETNLHTTTRRLIEWQLHTMVRPSEAAGTRWDEIDLENRLWNIPAERMKKKRPHSVPITPQALKILEKIRPLSSHREYVFVSPSNPRGHLHRDSANAAIRRMGFGGRLVAHGLRALASTTLNEQGFDKDLVEAALAHVEPNEVRRAYNRAEYIEQRRAMMEWWSNYI